MMGQNMPLTQRIPVKVQHLAEAHRLGAPVAVSTKAGSGVFVASAVILLLFVGIPLCSLISSLSNPAANADAAPIGFDVIWFVAVFSAIGFLFFIDRLRQIYVYTEGLIYRTWFKTGVLRWEQIAWAGREYQGRGSVSLSMRTTEGWTLTFPLTFPYDQRIQVCDLIEREVARTQGEQSYYQPAANYDPQDADSRRSDAYPGYSQPYEGSPIQPSYYPPAQPENPGANEDAVAVQMAKDKVYRRLATAGQLCGYAVGVPLILAILFGPPTAWIVGAFLGVPIAVMGMVFSGLGLRSSDKKTARQGLTYSIVLFVGVLFIAIVLLRLSSGAFQCC
jgi:hypothetical protein